MLNESDTMIRTIDFVNSQYLFFISKCRVQHTTYFAHGIIQNPKLSMGSIANKNEIARYKRLGYDYYYLGPAMPYKQKLQGYEIADVVKSYKFVNNRIIGIKWHTLIIVYPIGQFICVMIPL